MLERPRPRAPWFAKFALAAVAVLLYLPLLSVLGGAFSSLEGEAPWRWFAAVLGDAVLLKALWNSVLVGVCAAALSTALGAGAAIALHRGKFLGRGWLELGSSVSLVLPEIVFALALLSLFALIGLGLGLFTVVIAHVTFSLSYVLLTVGARLAGSDASLEDAARDLGASEARVLWTVTLPLLRPALGAAFLLSFLLSFDDFLITFFVNGVGSDTLPVKLYTSMKTGLTPKLNALAALMWFATAVILFFAFRSGAFRDVLKAGETTHGGQKEGL